MIAHQRRQAETKCFQTLRVLACVSRILIRGVRKFRKSKGFVQTKNATVFTTLAFFTLTACAPLVPTTDISGDEAVIRARDEVRFGAYRDGDLEAILAGYAGDAIVMPSDAPAAAGREAIRKTLAESFASAKADGLIRSLDNHTAVVSGNTGWSSGTFKETTAVAGFPVRVGKFVATWRKSEGKWLIVRDIWNSDGRLLAGNQIECSIGGKLGARACATLPFAGYCRSEANYASQGSLERTEMSFLNQSDEPVEIYWLNFQGERIKFQRLAPGHRWIQPTFVGHNWLATTMAGQCIGIFAAELGSVALF